MAGIRHQVSARRQAAAVSIAAVALGWALAACGAKDRPVLQRSARPVWCPSTVTAFSDSKLRSRGHGAFDARRVVGLDLDAATRLARRNGCEVRAVGGDVDGTTIITLDLRLFRIDVDVEAGTVVALDATYGPIG
jgi:hypothetical protein